MSTTSPHGHLLRPAQGADRRALHPRRRERAAVADARRHRRHGRPQAADGEPAAGRGLSDRVRRRARWRGSPASEPFATIDGIRMSRYRMFFSDAKARAELGYTARPYREGLSDAIDWFRAAGYRRESRDERPGTATELRSGKGATRRELPRRLAPDPSATSRRDPGLLRFRPRRRRRRRPRRAVARAQDRAARRPRRRPDRRRPVRSRGRAAQARARRPRPAAAPRARTARRVPDGRAQDPLRRLGRADPLLPLLGDAGRPLRPRRARRGSGPGLGRVGRDLRRPADHQPPPGLRQGLPRPRPGLPPAGHAGPARRHRRDARRRQGVAAAARRRSASWPSGRWACSTRARCCPT